MSAYGDEAADSVRSLSTDAKSTAKNLGGRISDAVDKGTHWVSKRTGDLDATSRELVESMSEAVRARPLVAVSVAAVAGFLFYRWFSRD